MTAQRYSKGAMLLHWLIAIAVIVNWRIAEAAEHAETREAAGAIMENHKALGITILLLTVARIAWRIMRRPPPLAAHLKDWERLLARFTHVAFYFLLIGLPIGGWLGNSYFGQGVDMFGIFTWPALPVGQDFEAGESILELHGGGGEVLLILAALHLLGVIKHMVVDRDGQLWRMLPFGTPKG